MYSYNYLLLKVDLQSDILGPQILVDLWLGSIRNFMDLMTLTSVDRVLVFEIRT